MCTEEEAIKVMPICQLKENSNSVKAVQMFHPVQTTIQITPNNFKPRQELNKTSSEYYIGNVQFSLGESAFKPFLKLKKELAEQL